MTPDKYGIPTYEELAGIKTTKKSRPIDKNIRMAVWKKYFGLKGDGKCYVCKRIIYIDHFQVGHNKARAKGGKDHITNLRPICAPCNLAMKTMSIETYKKKYFAKPKTKTKKKPAKKRKPKDPYKIDFELSEFKF
jgi:5-methylcytosine-specific restriction endonuclease McrA